jgi:hypothetical protein
MTPKEKALELYEKFIFPCWECDEFARAKECALIAVDELIKQERKTDDYYEIGSYWQEVKKEISNG